MEHTVKNVDPKAMYNIPNWVLNIKNDTEREEKIEMIQLYGSPNVFNQFWPQYVPFIVFRDLIVFHIVYQ